MQYLVEVRRVVDLQFPPAAAYLLDDDEAVHAQVVKLLAGSGEVELLGVPVAY